VDENKKAPMDLGTQMTYMLKKAVNRALSDVFKNSSRTIKAAREYERNFLNEFNTLRDAVRGKLKSGDTRGLDIHKLAAIACIALLRSCPMEVNEEREGHGANEIVAYILVVRLIRESQLLRLCRDDEEIDRIREKLGSFLCPEPINSHDPVSFNITMALSFLSRILTKRNETKSIHADDISWILSLLFFYMDVHSQAQVEKAIEEYRMA
jgi:hypothetical protein